MTAATVLVLQKAGDKTLAALLRSEGVPSLEMLARYGDDLLSAVASLERHGVVHRDIKPDNIGIRSLTKQRNQLILFDFSLARAPLDNIRVGTPGYSDPFLVNRKPRRWDLEAERYSAAVTLYEMTLGEGVLPAVGRRQVRPGADRRRTGHRRREVRPQRAGGVGRVLPQGAASRPRARASTTPTRCGGPGSRSSRRPNSGRSRPPAARRSICGVTLEQADLTTPVAALGLSTRARNALERAERPDRPQPAGASRSATST